MDARIFRATVLFVVYAALSSPAHAYLDPATGSMIIQAVIGFVATWIMYSKLFAHKVRSFFARSGRTESGNSQSE
jgi:hypothetical protein